jgi:hypothetical protein
MKRLNPDTGKPFKRGEKREDGFLFVQYQKTIIKEDGYFQESWLNPKSFKKIYREDPSGEKRTLKNVAGKLLDRAKGRCKGIPSRVLRGRPATNGNVTITRDWIIERLERGFCEATGDSLTIKPKRHNTASLDRIDPNNPNYTPENSRIVTWQFNNMKGAYSDEEFIRVAKQLEKTKKRKPTPVSTGSYLGSEIYPELGFVSSAGSRQDDDNPNHHSGAVQGQDVDHSAIENSTDSVGHRSKEVDALIEFIGIESNRECGPEIIRLDFSGRHISD